MPTAKPAAAQPLRQPLSLRELFCLTTLAAVVVALVLYHEWTTDERWLLALTLGGTLLGIFVARAIGWRAAWAISGGVISGCLTVSPVWTKCAESLSQFRFPPTDMASDITRFQRWYFSSAVAAILVLSLGLALAAFAAYRLLGWGTDGTDRGLAAAVRRMPLRAAVATLSLVLAGLAW
jgi:hypothetical protein